MRSAPRVSVTTLSTVVAAFGLFAAFGLLGAFGLLAACSTLPREKALPLGELAWPPGNPRVRLDHVIATRADARKGSALDWIAGRRDEPLFDRPFAASWLGGSLVIADPGAHRVVITGEGRAPRTSAAGVLDTPMGVASCLAGVVVADARLGKVALFDRELHLVRWLAQGLDRPTGIGCVGDRVFVVETGAHRVVVLEPDGTRQTVGVRGSGPGEFNFPAALTTTPGDVWVGDTMNFRLQRFDAATLAPVGAFGHLGDAPGEMPRIKGLAVDAQGHLWVSDASLDQVALYRTDGTFLMDLGRNGRAPGEFAFPAGIAAHPDGRVAVVDSLNRRIQVFRIIPAGGKP